MYVKQWLQATLFLDVTYIYRCMEGLFIKGEDSKYESYEILARFEHLGSFL